MAKLGWYPVSPDGEWWRYGRSDGSHGAIVLDADDGWHAWQSLRPDVGSYEVFQTIGEASRFVQEKS